VGWATIVTKDPSRPYYGVTLDTGENEFLWCADYTMSLSVGQKVGTIEIDRVDNGSTRSFGQGQRVIAPGGAYSFAKYGEVKSTLDMRSGAAAALAYVMKRGADKWRPLYRRGVATQADLENNLVYVQISIPFELSVDVWLPMDYMLCNSQAIDEYPEEYFPANVIVEYELGTNTPSKVIGFVEFPFECEDLCSPFLPIPPLVLIADFFTMSKCSILNLMPPIVAIQQELYPWFETHFLYGGHRPLYLTPFAVSTAAGDRKIIWESSKPFSISPISLDITFSGDTYRLKYAFKRYSSKTGIGAWDRSVTDFVLGVAYESLPPGIPSGLPEIDLWFTVSNYTNPSTQPIFYVNLYYRSESLPSGAGALINWPITANGGSFTTELSPPGSGFVDDLVNDYQPNFPMWGNTRRLGITHVVSPTHEYATGTLDPELIEETFDPSSAPSSIICPICEE